MVVGAVLCFVGFFTRGQAGFLSSADPFARGWGRGSVAIGRTALALGAACLVLGLVLLVAS
jgi:hypothetical protein